MNLEQSITVLKISKRLRLKDFFIGSALGEHHRRLFSDPFSVYFPSQMKQSYLMTSEPRQERDKETFGRHLVAAVVVERYLI